MWTTAAGVSQRGESCSGCSRERRRKVSTLPNTPSRSSAVSTSRPTVLPANWPHLARLDIELTARRSLCPPCQRRPPRAGPPVAYNDIEAPRVDPALAIGCLPPHSPQAGWRPTPHPSGLRQVQSRVGDSSRRRRGRPRHANAPGKRLKVGQSDIASRCCAAGFNPWACSPSPSLI